MELNSLAGTPFERTERISDQDLSREEFADRLSTATRRCITAADGYVVEQLDTLPARYKVTRWVYNAPGLTVDSEVIGPNQTMADFRLYDFEETLRVIWQHDRFPRWINTGVEDIVDGYVVVRLQFSCCFGKDKEPHRLNDIFPFNLRLPMPPTDDWHHGSPPYSLSDPRRE